MNINGYLNFFSHETQTTIMEDKLHSLYGINNIKIEESSPIGAIVQKTLLLCKELGATDRNFFGFPLLDRKVQIADYLSIDALFHIRKEAAKDDYHTSFRSFIDATAQHCDIHDKDLSNISKNMKNIFMRSTLCELLGITHIAPNSNYLLPKFMDRLLLLLIDTIKKNPYQATGLYEHKFSTLNTFFVKSNFYSRLRRLYEDDAENQLIASYLADRLFDVNTVTYIIQQLRDIETQVKPTSIINHLLPIYYVPNPFAKRIYCDKIFTLLNIGEEIQTEFDYWDTIGEGVVVNAVAKSPISIEDQIMRKNLVKCRRYLLFLSTIYYPVLTSCFYILLKKAHPDTAETVLLDYLRDRKYCGALKGGDTEWKDRITQFYSEERQCFSWTYHQLYETIYEEEKRIFWKASTSLDYITSPLYQKNILEIVMKSKLEIPVSEKPLFIHLDYEE